MKNALLLHGTSSSSQSNWLPWLKTKLEERGWKVWVPDLPGAEAPNAKRYTEFLLSKDWEFNAESIVVGHSSGAVEIFALLEALPEGAKINAAILVGAFKDDLSKASLIDFFRRPLSMKVLKKRFSIWRNIKKGNMDLRGLFEKPFDFEKIKTRAKKFIFIHSDDDPYCPLRGAKYLAQILGGELQLIPGQKHFSVGTAGEKYKEFPYILELIETL